ncbi:MAG: MlaD family protein [Gemmatimonadota bacterium]|nr:MlaD family protein [Gemmatimonadota bacterium]
MTRPRASVALVVIALAIVVAGVVAARRPGTEKRIYALVPAGTGTRSEVTVSYLGVTVGRVSAVRDEPPNVRLTLDLFRRDLPLREGDTVHVRRLGVLGDNLIDIAGGPRSEPLLRDGGVLTVSTTPSPIPRQFGLPRLRDRMR